MKKLQKKFTGSVNTLEAYRYYCSCDCSWHKCLAYCSATWENQQNANQAREDNDAYVQSSLLRKIGQ